MSLSKLIAQNFKRFLPSPFTIAVLLTFFTLMMAILFAEIPDRENRPAYILKLWESGIWNNGLLVFAYQMMLILVLGHVLVLSRPVEALILKLTRLVKNSANAAVLVALPTMLVAFFNWGLGLIFGALLARKVGEYAQRNGIPINYPLIGASGYLGLMVWHSGISGSAPLKIAESGHLNDLMTSSQAAHLLKNVPERISTSQTVFSPSNLLIFIIVLTTISIVVYFLGKHTRATPLDLKIYDFKRATQETSSGAERLDHSRWLSLLFGLLILGTFLIQYLSLLKSLNLTPNLLNFFMLGLGIVLHKNFSNFLAAVHEAISDVSGILIQFPLYFGIMGVMSGSGMIGQISDFFVAHSTPLTLPLFTFFSAGLVNIFVPSGGGQWAIQGPLVIESALTLGVPLPKAIMALAYGDQLTNMLQPFWALPLLAITKLKAKEILPYTLLFMLIAGIIYFFGVLIF